MNLTTSRPSPLTRTAPAGAVVAVVGGGPSAEHEVSLATADAVQAALGRTGHSVVRLDRARDGGWLDAEGRPVSAAQAVAVLSACDVLFPLIHGPGGEDGTMAALAESIGVAVVGSGVAAGAMAMDKWVTKLVAHSLGIRTAQGVLLRRGEEVTFTHPVVVKPVRAGSSQGVSLVSRATELDAALAGAFAHDDRVLVEELLVGREIDVAVMRRADGSLLVTPSLEIAVPGFFDYTAKYDGSATFTVPAPLSPGEVAGLEDAATALFTALGCAGIARVDFFLTPAGWVLNEVNTIPGMTEHSQVPQMAAAAGIGYDELVAELVLTALPGRGRADRRTAQRRTRPT
jgi:D-alanine-D-alanine ligase